MKRRIRDSQRNRVYLAEGSLPETHLKDFTEDSSETTRQEIQAYVYKVLGRARVHQRFGGHWVCVSLKRANAKKSEALPGNIYMAPIHRSKVVVLHELAHCLTPGARHGWKFCEVYLFLVREAMGKDVADRLKAQFKLHKVRFRKPIKRTITLEQKAVLIKRLAHARAVKRQKSLSWEL